jgi:hypothetical protein
MSKITRDFATLSDRYVYDFRYCHYRDGWAQLDTRQDASYYGNWINPISLRLFSYCEGDLALTECDSETDFIATVRECVAWHRERDYFVGIDAMCSVPIIEAFTRMGLAEFLH